MEYFAQSVICHYLELIIMVNINDMIHSEVFDTITSNMDYFAKTKFLWAISKCGVKYFEQSAMNLYLELLKAQHSQFFWLIMIMKYLLQSPLA